MTTTKLDRMKTKVARATVRFLAQGGQGVVVPSGLIVTAAHVIQWDGRGQMAGPLGTPFFENVEIGRQKVRAEVYAVEPCADIAVLGAPTWQDLYEEAEAFETALAAIPPVQLCTKDFPLQQPVAAFLRAHTGAWIAGRAAQYAVNASALQIEAEKGIEGGTSGGPVVTAQGLLLGVVSTAGGVVGEPHREGTVPRVHLTVPGWLTRRMLDPEWEVRANRRAAREFDRRNPEKRKRIRDLARDLLTGRKPTSTETG